MLYVKIPKDLREYKQKVIMGRTAQELFWIALALILGVAVFGLSYVTIGEEIGSYLTMAVAIPLFMCAFITVQDMPLLEFVKKVIKFYKIRQFVVYDNCLLIQSHQKSKPSKEAKKFKKELKKMNEND